MALDDCTYDSRTAQPVEGSVIDADEDLVALCSRMQESDNKHLAILFCEERDLEAPPPSRRTPTPAAPRLH